MHAIASIRAVENAIGATPPPNARLLRNLIIASQCVQDHVIHFYHLHALDWVDIVSALSADPAKTSALAQSISDWPLSSPTYFTGVQDRVKDFVERGQLGPFANAYWGHPAYKLPPEANLMAVAHYLEALDWQREFIKIHAILGGKNPHLQSFLVGGMATPVDPDKQASINAGTIAGMRGMIAKARDFVTRVYIPDLLAVASFYKDWAGYGGGCRATTSSTASTRRRRAEAAAVPAVGRDPQGRPPEGRGLRSRQDHRARQALLVRVRGRGRQGPASRSRARRGRTTPGPSRPTSGSNTDGKYSWLKSPRYDGEPMEVGPLARMLVAYASGHPRVKELVGPVLQKLGRRAGGPLLDARPRGRARDRDPGPGREDGGLARRARRQHGQPRPAHPRQLEVGPRAPGRRTARAPASTRRPRGALGHWVHIKDGAIANYQCVVPSTWNAGPRDAAGKRGPYEEALARHSGGRSRPSRSRSCAPSTPSIPAWPAASTWWTRSGASSRG